MWFFLKYGEGGADIRVNDWLRRLFNSSMPDLKEDKVVKRLFSMLLTVALVVGLVPSAFAASSTSSGSYFMFPTEYYNLESPPITISEQLNLSGTLNGVNDKSISYSVSQVTRTTDGKVQVVSPPRTGLTGYINASGNKITVNNIQLFPGLNQIVFTGKQGSTEVTDTPLYVEYQNGPSIYNLKANLSQGSRNVEMKEEESAVLIAPEGTAFYGANKADISITGTAPSADKISVEVNGRIWNYNLSSYNNYEFIASPVNVNVGKNLVKLTVYNKNQKLETTREITFFNGNATFYDVIAQQEGRESTDLMMGSEFGVNTGNLNAITISGKTIIPVKDNDYAKVMKYQFSGGANSGVVEIPLNFDTTDTSKGFMIGSFNMLIPSPSIDSKITLDLDVGGIKSSANVTLRDKDKAYIAEVNYLSGYNPGMGSDRVLGLTGSALDGATVSALPTAIEVLVVNGTANTEVDISSVVDSKGNSLGTPIYKTIARGSITKTINGYPTEMTRIIMELSQLPTNGYQKMTFMLNNGNTKIAAVTLLYGPFVQFTSLIDDQQIMIDTTSSSNAASTLVSALDQLKGKLVNVPNVNDIIFSGTKPSVFLYVNNVSVPLIKDGDDATKFKVDINNVSFDEGKLYKLFNPGENTIRFVFNSNKNIYERSYKVNVVPLNVPKIPADGTLGIIPFSYVDINDRAPVQLDLKFEKNGSVYSTKEHKMNVYGTFDFIDLGNGDQIQAKLNDLEKEGSREKYILKITTPSADGKDKEYKWDLSKEFFANTTYNPGGQFSDLSVFYDPTQRNFSFILRNQEIPEDGTPKVYSIRVYNNGEGGPSASERLEVIKNTSPMNRIRPLDEKMIVNQNFIEVIISSDKASEVMVGKEKAEKFAYDIDYDGVVDYPNAFRLVVKDLKPNKENKIKIVATIGTDKIDETISVHYVPTNIPGAQYMMEMKNSHKVFEGAINLTFPKGTNLIRRDYNIPEQLKNQVFTGHDILFAIGNSDDGVVNRYEFEGVPKDFDEMVRNGQREFISNFQSRFVKASPVFWIDPGLADRINTNEYDPVKQGVDPYQFAGSGIKMFYDRDPLDELVPSKRGTLTLTYDANVSQDAGKVVTVFYYNPEIKKWENIGGVVDPKKHTIKVSFDKFGYYVVAKLGYSFQDIIDHPYARDFVETLYAKGVMNAFDPVNEFGVAKYVNRGEFTKMIVKAKDMSLNYMGPKHFSELPNDPRDVNPDALYDFRYIETAARAGIVRGIQPQYFDAENGIKRQDAAVIIAKALNLKLETDRAKITKGLQKYFKDYSDIGYYAQASVLAVAQKGFIQGSLVNTSDPSKGYMFNPGALTLRADASIIMARVMIDSKKLPKM